MEKLPVAPPESLIFDNDRVYVCLASYPLTHGHRVVVWKDETIKDLSLLSCDQYDYLMNVVDVTRDTLLKVLNLEKIYLLYMDEVKQVHWHLIPRYDEQGINILAHIPKLITDFSLATELKKELAITLLNHPEIVII